MVYYLLKKNKKDKSKLEIITAMLHITADTLQPTVKACIQDYLQKNSSTYNLSHYTPKILNCKFQFLQEQITVSFTYLSLEGKRTITDFFILSKEQFDQQFLDNPTNFIKKSYKKSLDQVIPVNALE